MTSKDETFTAFTPEQAAAYASNRGHAYPLALYEHILQYHTGSRDVVLDVGTGPGKVVFDLSTFFSKAIGCDAGPQMIEQARKGAARLGVEEKATFVVCEAEKCADASPAEQVDMLTVAMAVHWFELPKFYESAAKVLRPGGTLAIWVASSIFVHPSVPRHEEIQEILFDLEKNMLRPYHAPGNLLAQSGYENLQLPWNVPGSKTPFDEASYQRKDWDRHGVPSSPPLEDGTPGPFLLGRASTVDQFVAALGSASPVIRWREANPDKAHGDEDPINITAKKLREVTGDMKTVTGGPSCSLLLMRRAE